MRRTLELDLNTLSDEELKAYLVLRLAVVRKKIEDDNKGWVKKAEHQKKI